ncbi:MAG: LacI family DNA-binding transcriptional regulator [Candidatus Onthomonas sp.]
MERKRLTYLLCETDRREKRMVTIKMVSEQCGVSPAAVSKALNGQPGISPEKAEYVRKVAQEMGYHPNAAARTLRMNRSRNIGVLFQNGLAHEFFSVVLDAARTEAEQRGYDITFLSNNIGQAGMSFYEHARQRQCDGVIIVQGDYLGGDVMRLVESDIPVVSIDHTYNGRSSIVNDNVGSMEEIIQYLFTMGHTKIAFIHGEDGDVTRQRLAGFHRGCRNCGIEVPEEYILAAKYHEPKDSGQATRQLLAYRNRPTCILYPDDISYLGGMTEIERQGLSVPDDISCFGYDGIRMASVLRPRLSTYQQDAEEIGKRATDELISAIENAKYFVPQVISITGQIQTGGTVKNLRSPK